MNAEWFLWGFLAGCVVTLYVEFGYVIMSDVRRKWNERMGGR